MYTRSDVTMVTRIFEYMHTTHARGALYCGYVTLHACAVISVLRHVFNKLSNLKFSEILKYMYIYIL